MRKKNAVSSGKLDDKRAPQKSEDKKKWQSSSIKERTQKAGQISLKLKSALFSNNPEKERFEMEMATELSIA